VLLILNAVTNCVVSLSELFNMNLIIWYF